MSRAAEAAMAASYKALKEDFVSNLTGGSIREINLVTAVAPVAILLYSTLQSCHSFFTPYTPLAFTIDFLLNVCAILLSTTLYADQPLLLNLLLLAPALIIYFLPNSKTSSSLKKPKLPPKTGEKRKEFQNPLPKKPFLTTYRGTMMVITCLAILAVDFRLFPRRFAKVETWGTSLMDVGVGSFVFSAGVVGARGLLKENVREQSTSLGTKLYRSIRHSVPLLVLGFVRLWSVKGLDYAEHITEYGVHWNFFFTLGCLPPFLALFESAFKYVPSYAGLAVLLAGVYQVALEFTNLKAYVLTAPRTDLLSQNREGVFSFFGYLAIFLAGQSTGMFLLPRSTGWDKRRGLLLRLGAWSGTWITLFALSSSYYGLNLGVSRRMANLPYFLWIAAFNTSQILAFLVVETVFFPGTWKSNTLSAKEEEEIYKTSTSRVLEAFNRNGLAIFLVANLGTGLVNLTVPTLHVNDLQAMGILLVYAGALTGLVVGLDAYGISIKM